MFTESDSFTIFFSRSCPHSLFRWQHNGQTMYVYHTCTTCNLIHWTINLSVFFCSEKLTNLRLWVVVLTLYGLINATASLSKGYNWIAATTVIVNRGSSHVNSQSNLPFLFVSFSPFQSSIHSFYSYLHCTTHVLNFASIQLKTRSQHQQLHQNSFPNNHRIEITCVYTLLCFIRFYFCCAAYLHLFSLQILCCWYCCCCCFFPSLYLSI